MFRIHRNHVASLPVYLKVRMGCAACLLPCSALYKYVQTHACTPISLHLKHSHAMPTNIYPEHASYIFRYVWVFYLH